MVYNSFEEIRDRILSKLEEIQDKNTICFVEYNALPNQDFICLRVLNYIHQEERDVKLMIKGNLVGDKLPKLTSGYVPLNGDTSTSADFCIPKSNLDKIGEYVDYLQSQGKRVKIKETTDYLGILG